MTVVPAFGTWIARLLAATSLGTGFAGVFQIVGAILARLFFGLAPERLGLQLAILAPELLDFRFQLCDTPTGLGMHAFPVACLLPQFEIFAGQPVDPRT